MPPDGPVLSEDEVHIWGVSLHQSSPCLEMLSQFLSQEERTRTERFHFDRDRRRFIVSQGYLRILLGRYLDMRPKQIEFFRGARGKPDLKTSKTVHPEAAKLRFNLSHSHELAVYAVTKGREIGIDIEHIRPVSDAANIVKRFFSSQEQAAFFSLSEEQQIEAFFNCWTRKEAFIKAIGEGLFHPLDQFSVSLKPGEPARLLHIGPEPHEKHRWLLRAFVPASGYVAAVVAEGQSWRLKCWRTEKIV